MGVVRSPVFGPVFAEPDQAEALWAVGVEVDGTVGARPCAMSPYWPFTSRASYAICM